jgi:hypothetical protein
LFTFGLKDWGSKGEIVSKLGPEAEWNEMMRAMWNFS